MLIDLSVLYSLTFPRKMNISFIEYNLLIEPDYPNPCYQNNLWILLNAHASCYFGNFIKFPHKIQKANPTLWSHLFIPKFREGTYGGFGLWCGL